MFTPTNTSLSSRLAAEFRAEAARQNISTGAIARALGVSRQTVWNQLKGNTTLSEPSMTAIASVLNLPLSTLMKRAEAQSPAADRTAA